MGDTHGEAQDEQRDGRATGRAAGGARLRAAGLARGEAATAVEGSRAERPGLRLGEEALPGTFLPGSNIGLVLGEPSGGLVDVDCDSIVALIVAARLLPPTGMAYGRSKGIGLPTHYLYQTEGELPKTEKFQYQEPSPPAPFPEKEGGSQSRGAGREM